MNEGFQSNEMQPLPWWKENLSTESLFLFFFLEWFDIWGKPCNSGYHSLPVEFSDFSFYGSFAEDVRWTYISRNT